MNLQDLPTGARNLLDDYRNQLEALGGNTLNLPDSALVQVYQNGTPDTLSMFAQDIASIGALGPYKDAQPWIQYGLNFDQYQSQAGTFATEYKKITGQDISGEALSQAFSSLKDVTGGLLTGSEYAQRLQNDKNIQKTYGWVKYGLDYQQFQQQKLQMRQSFGKDLTDQEATAQLQYFHAAQGGNREVTAQQQQSSQSKQQPGVGGSVIR